MNIFDTFDITPPSVTLANNGVSVVFDTTYSANTASWVSTAAGTLRNQFPRWRIIGWILCTDQNVTARLDYLTDAGAWSTGAKSQTCTAGTEQPISWLANSTDWRLVVVNGATGPTTLTLNGFHLTNNPDSAT